MAVGQVCGGRVGQGLSWLGAEFARGRDIQLPIQVLRLKTMILNIAQQFMKEMVKIYFGLLKILVKFLIN